MQVQQAVLKGNADTAAKLAPLVALRPNLVLVFGAPAFFEATDGAARNLAALFPGAVIAGCSTAGEISAHGVEENSCVVTAARFAATALHAASCKLSGMDDSRAAGRRLAERLAPQRPTAVLVLGQGVDINGSALIEGMAEVLGEDVAITGGLAGDNAAFKRTWVVGPDGVASDTVVAVGFAGEKLNFAHGSFGGWEPFGPARKVTRCAGNVLFELDGEPALAVYKRYLGDHADGLPASGLLFPFSILGEDERAIGLIRTILAVNEADGSLVLAGEIQSGGYLKLMHASTDGLVNGAEAAAKAAHSMRAASGDSLAILVSCVGRKLVMGDRVDEEVEAVGDVFGAQATLTGFYSYGEISPFAPGVACKLHNQTMTITCIGEGA